MLNILQTIFTIIGIIVTIAGIITIVVYRSWMRFTNELEESAKEIAKINAEIVKREKKEQIIHINNLDYLGANRMES